MVTFRGFTTKNQFKNFSINDIDLIKTDLLNAFNIKQGEKPGNPTYGSSIWSFVFEPLTDAVVERIIEESRRVITSDPRIGVEDINVFTRDGGVLLEMDLFLNTGATPLSLRLQFDESSRSVRLD